MIGIRRPHEKALTGIIQKIATHLAQEEKRLDAEVQAWKVKSETLEKLAMIQDLSSRRHQVRVLRRDVARILRDSNNLLVATILPTLEQ